MAEEQTPEIGTLKLQLEFKYRPWIYLIDLTLRIFVFYFYIKDTFPTWLFIGLQIAIFALDVFYNGRYIEKLKKEFTPYINEKYARNKIQVVIGDNIPTALLSIQTFFGLIFSYWFLMHTIDNHSWYMHILFVILAFLGAIVFVGVQALTVRYKESRGDTKYKVELTLTNVKRSESPITIDVTKQYPDILLQAANSQNSAEIIEFDSVDYNDTQIAKLESELKSINHRVDAYMLESVFLGGLSFSGFLTVAAANFLGDEPKVFRQFTEHIARFFTTCSNEGFTSWFGEVQKHFIRDDLYILIMLLCLLASVFFLLVLTLRLRLNSLSLNMDHMLRIMTIFNAKEEELFNLKAQNELVRDQTNRLKNISKKIDLALSDANKLLGELKPTVTMMSVYRNFALFMFYLVLIASGFYFMPVVAGSIFALAIFTQVFRLFETYSKLSKIRDLIRKH